MLGICVVWHFQALLAFGVFTFEVLCSPPCALLLDAVC